MEKILEALLTPAVGYVTTGIIILAILLSHFRQMALIRTGLIKKAGLRRWRVDHDKLFGGLVLVFLGGAILVAKYYNLSFWLGLWIFIALLGLNLVVFALLGRGHWRKSSWD